MSERHDWERQPGETRQAYSAFSTYRDLGPNRSQDKAYHAHAGPQGDGKKRAPPFWAKWATKWQWFERTEAYDAHLDAIARAAAEAKEIEAAQKLVDLRAKIKRDELNNAQALIDKAGEMLKFPLQRQITRRDDPDGLQLITI